jgi:hypothetical protein
MSLPLGFALLAMALPAATPAAPPVAVSFDADNGSVPPPYRRSTSIEIAADGSGRLVRLLGYDQQDPAQRFEYAFKLSATQQQAFARRLEELGLWTTRWRERERVPVGGPYVHLSFRRGDEKAVLPAYPVQRQEAAVEMLRSEVRALVPEAATTARQAWEQGRGEPE